MKARCVKIVSFALLFSVLLTGCISCQTGGEPGENTGVSDMPETQTKAEETTDRGGIISTVCGMLTSSNRNFVSSMEKIEDKIKGDIEKTLAVFELDR